MTHPLGYLHGHSFQSASVTPLLWYSIIVSVVVCVIISALVLMGILKRRAAEGAAEIGNVPVCSGGNGVRWIWVGLAVSIVPLIVALVWTVGVLAHVGSIPRQPAITIDVSAKQWWWDVTYSGSASDTRFHTANEIHIPVGLPVLLRLDSTDVIHSFWVPRLAGKMDVIPGQTNLVWLQADKPGRYRGQCAEFCGFQHAHMGFEVVAEQPADFKRWWQGQIRPAAPPATPAEAHGLALVEYRCGLCHAVRGTQAGAGAAPDLTHLMSRRTIAAGTLPNTPGSLAGWIENPQAAKPGSLMPDQGLSGPDLNDVRAYLETLK